MNENHRERLERLSKDLYYYGHGVGQGVQEIDDALIEMGYAKLEPTTEDDPLHEYCPHLVVITDAGRAALDQGRELATALEKMVSLWMRKTEECPHCGAHVESMEQVGRCVYSRPCGCRQLQGRVPKEWGGK